MEYICTYISNKTHYEAAEDATDAATAAIQFHSKYYHYCDAVLDHTQLEDFPCEYVEYFGKVQVGGQVFLCRILEETDNPSISLYSLEEAMQGIEMVLFGEYRRVLEPFHGVEYV